MEQAPSSAKQNDDDDLPHFTFSSRGSSHSGWARYGGRKNMTTQWRQLYLSRAKLKAVSRTSALIAGFAMVAMVEVQLDRGVDYDQVLLILFSTVTTCLVAVHLFALMIATCMLPNIEAVSNIHNVKAIQQSPHHKMRMYIEIAWILSTGVGLVLFLIEIALLIWLKFLTIVRPTTTPANPSTTPQTNTEGEIPVPAIVATAVLVPVVILFAGFAIHFYRTLAQHRYTIFKDAFNELEIMAKNEDDLVRLHPNSAYGEGGFHAPVSRMPSGASIQSQGDAKTLNPVTTSRPEITLQSRTSSFSGRFSVDHV